MHWLKSLILDYLKVRKREQGCWLHKGNSSVVLSSCFRPFTWLKIHGKDLWESTEVLEVYDQEWEWNFQMSTSPFLKWMHEWTRSWLRRWSESNLLLSAIRFMGFAIILFWLGSYAGYTASVIYLHSQERSKNVHTHALKGAQQRKWFNAK